jgi:hypothetical protein
MRRTTGTILFATIWLAAGIVAASAQGALMPGLSLQNDKPKLTPEEQAKADKLDRAYRAATQSTPDQKAPDPWGNVRSNSPAKPGTARTSKPSAAR